MNFDCCGFFKALSDPTRIQILNLLKKGELCVSDICVNFNMKQPSISHHLTILKNAKIVSSRKEGKEVFYSLNKICISDCCSDFVGSINDE